MMIRPRRAIRFLVPGLVCLVVLTQCVGPSPEAPPGEDPTATDPLADRIGTGTARVTGTIRSADLEASLPLGGALIMLGDAVSHSNVDGTFVLLGVPAGRQRFFVDAAELKARDGHFGQFLGDLEIAPDQDRNLERPIYLPFIPGSLEQTIAPDAVTQIVTDDGVIVDIPPGGARLGGMEYAGPIAILSVPPERAPLAWPSRFDDRIDASITIQPVGLEFPVPLSITFPADGGEPQEGALRSLWSLIGDAEAVENVAVSVRSVDRIAPLAGGLRTGGWHILTGMEFVLREPCTGGQPDEATACLDAASGLLNEVQRAATVRLPGAAAVFAELADLLASRQRSVERAQSIIDASEALFAIARDAVVDYQQVYQDLKDLSGLRAALAIVRTACSPVVGCNATSFERQAMEDEVGGQLASIAANVAAYSPLFDRLDASMGLLDPFFARGESLTRENLSSFAAATEEFQQALDPFGSADAPVAAYDTLVADLTELERSSRELVDAASAGRDGGERGDLTIARVCENLGTTQIGRAVDGVAPLDVRVGMGAPAEDCLIVALNSIRGLTSRPEQERRFAAMLHPPALVPLVARITGEAVRLGQPASGRLTQESPVHQWSFAPTERSGLHVRFAGEGDVLAGFAAANGVVQVARSGGFDVFNVPGDDASALFVFAEDFDDGDEVPYRFSVAEDPSLFDFGSPVAGAFDVETRAAAILFSGQAGQRMLIERSCCDPLGTLFSFVVLGPDGAEVPRVDFVEAQPGLGSELFELPSGGLHRVVITPFDDQFADWALSVGSVPSPTPVNYELGTVAEATLANRGERITFLFGVTGHATLTVEGLSSTGPDPLRVTLLGPEEGEETSRDATLFFDGSTFSTRMFRLSTEGVYRLSFRAPLDADPATGTFSFRAFVDAP